MSWPVILPSPASAPREGRSGISGRIRRRCGAVALALALHGPVQAAPQGDGTIPLPAPRPAEIAAQAELFPAPPPPAMRAVPLPLRRPPDLPRGDADVDEAEAATMPDAPMPQAAPGIPPPLAQAPAGKAPGETAPADTGTGATAPDPAPAAGGLAAACAAAVADGAIVAMAETGLTIGKGCALPDPVRLTGVRRADGGLIRLTPAAVLRCDAALAVAAWAREDLAPAIAALGTELSAIKVAASYDCRPRNRQAGARMSEHGFGNAFDVGGFLVRDRRTLIVADRSFPMSLQTRMKASACMRFSTVLGPGSDGFHEDHVHVDLARRRNNLSLCRWTLKGEGAAKLARDNGRRAPPAEAGGQAPPPGAGGTAPAAGAQDPEQELDPEAAPDQRPARSGVRATSQSTPSTSAAKPAARAKVPQPLPPPEGLRKPEGQGEDDG